MKETRFTRIGFILAAAGSAIGLGNIWRFPYITGEYGGGAFVLVYLATLALVGIPILMAEILLGSITQKEPVGAYESLAPTGKKQWRFAGFTLLGAFVILTFYTVVIGWVLAYFFTALAGLPQSTEEAKTLFVNLVTQEADTQIFFHAIAMLLTGWVVYKGIKNGIERVNTVLMPALFLMLLFLFFYAVSLDSFGRAVSFMFAPDFSKLSADAVLVAVGQAFFSLSLGMTVILTYASFSNDRTRALPSALTIASLDTLVALVAGLAMFAFLFDQNMPSAQSVGLAFISMPAVFYQFGGAGQVLALIFFASLAFAGLTSAISILEPTVAHLTQRRRWSRAKATWLPLLVAYLLGVVTLLSNVAGFEWLSFGGKNLFDWADFVTAAIVLPVGGLLLAVFMGYAADRQRITAHLRHEGLSMRAIAVWFWLLRYLAPVAVVGVIAAKVMGL
ncbi:MAG: sodium-dependent transporter [Campylobacterales bacterium]